MKINHHIWIIAITILAMCSCLQEDNKETGSTYNKTFVTGYLSPISIHTENVSSGVKITFKGDVITSGTIFDNLSKSNNDLSYNRYTVCGPRIAMDNAISSVKVETIEDFDSSHPAGSDISELIECRYISYYDYIQSGYKSKDKELIQYPDLWEYYHIEGAELLKDDLSIIDDTKTKIIVPHLVLKFKKAPEDKKTSLFKLKFYMSEKKVETYFEYEF